MVGRDLDVALATGEVLALLGPNGGGKTTLLKTLLGMLAPQAGEVRLDGRRSRAISIRERARLHRLCAAGRMSPTFAFTVEAVVLMGRTAHGNLFSRPSAADRAVAARALERFGIAHLRERPYTMISGGERQLVLLARALAQEPQFIVLDEPTASLDFGNQGKVMREIRALAAAGHGVLFTTHDPNHALRAADRAYLLRDGRADRRRCRRRRAHPRTARRRSTARRSRRSPMRQRGIRRFCRDEAGIMAGDSDYAAPAFAGDDDLLYSDDMTAPKDDYLIQPDPLDPRLTERVTGVDQTGATIETAVTVERALTIFLNSQEIVTAMTIGDYPEYLAHRLSAQPEHAAAGRHRHRRSTTTRTSPSSWCAPSARPTTRRS